MASEKQRAANRLNASKSTGPRSPSGKSRARRNAWRHGLSASVVSNAVFAREVEELAQKIAGSDASVEILEGARAVARAELELARVRRAKVAALACFLALDEPDPPHSSISLALGDRVLDVAAGNETIVLSETGDGVAEMSMEGPGCLPLALRSALPELLKLERYELRASARRDHAVRAFYYNCNQGL